MAADAVTDRTEWERMTWLMLRGAGRPYIRLDISHDRRNQPRSPPFPWDGYDVDCGCAISRDGFGRSTVHPDEGGNCADD